MAGIKRNDLAACDAGMAGACRYSGSGCGDADPFEQVDDRADKSEPIADETARPGGRADVRALRAAVYYRYRAEGRSTNRPRT